MRLQKTLSLMLALSALLVSEETSAQERVLDERLHHLRAGSEREWASFPAQAEAASLVVSFEAAESAGEQTLRLRQQDVKQAWRILLNGRALGTLHRDENDMVVYWPVPPGVLVAGENLLRIEPVDAVPDDIRVGAVVLDARPVHEVLSEATVDVSAVETGTGKPVPARITVVDTSGALQTLGASSNGHVAVRPGIVYTGAGRARFGLPAGTYTLYAGRGFEYGVDSTRLVLKAGDHAARRLGIRREVPTEGYVSCDPHLHTETHSGHGDATLEERMLTIAGEGIELPVATDHNVHVDYEAAAKKMGVRAYFTPVVGNEVTTRLGHFNIFPAAAGAPPPDHQAPDWPSLFRGIYSTPGVRAVILNHARDVHSGYRPFGAAHHHAVVGENLDGWVLRANAMELVNSGAQQTDVMRLYHDWFGMLNRGHLLTPVGASDSHDVGRYIAGQGRTYIRCRDDDPGRIDVSEAVEHFLQGQVMVSLGLLAEITVNGRYGPGALVPAAEEVHVEVRVLGPGWVTAEQVELYANGRKIHEATIAEGQKAGVKWQGTWRLARPKHDVHLVAVARGPGVHQPFWPLAKPYQPDGPAWEARVIGSTGAVWIDADADGRRTSAYAYASAVVEAFRENLAALFQQLADYDEAVAAQVASLLQMGGTDLEDPAVVAALEQAAPATRRGFAAFVEAAQASRLVRRQR